MSDINTVVIISDRHELVNRVAQKLVLLRDLDKVKSCSIEEAQNLLKNANPNVLIIHCDNNDTEAIELIKKIKKTELLKSVPILLINENCSREVIIEAFDSGVSDVIFTPIIDYELLIRVIWCLQKNELNLNIESNNSFLCKLGIIQGETGVYSCKYCDEIIKNEIMQTKKYPQKACLLLISPDKKYPDKKNPTDFITAIKNSVRLNDLIVVKDDNQYYVYLQKTKLNGAYSVFERINANLGSDSGANAGVIEIHNQSYKEIKEALKRALKKANENTNSLIVANDSDEGFDDEEETPKIQNIENIESTSDIIKESITAKEEKPKHTVDEAAGTYDKTSVRIFNQAFARKLKVVIEPVFRKYENILKLKRQDFAINAYVGNKSAFCVSTNKISMSLAIEYDGLQCVVIKIVIIENNQKRLSEMETIDFTILDSRRLSLMLGELIDKYILMIKRS